MSLVLVLKYPLHHRHIRRLTTEVNAPMPVVDTALQHMLTARALHEAQARTGSTDFPVLDWSALVAGTRVAAGLDPLKADKVRLAVQLCQC